MKGFLGIGFDPAKFQKATVKEYVVRFAFGGCITAITGMLAHEYGPLVGGLFLAFPAILPASVTLIHDHDGHQKAGVDALGAAAGSLGLLAFAIVIWLLALVLPAWLVLAGAALAWLIVSLSIWSICRVVKRRGEDALPPKSRSASDMNPGSF